MDWLSDAQVVIKQVLEDKEPENWNIRNEILFLQKFRQDTPGWDFQWTPRSANACADAAAKWARKQRRNVAISDSFSVFIPFFLLNFISDEIIAVPSLV